jgi:hypothetical protein
MASSFINASKTLTSISQDVYTAPSGARSAVVHSIYFSCTSDLSGTSVTLTVYDSVGLTTKKVLNNVPIAPNSTLVLEKPINLKPNDKLSAQAANSFCDMVASILLIT